MVIGGGYMSVLVGDVIREIRNSYSQVSSLLRHLSAFWRFRVSFPLSLIINPIPSLLIHHLAN